MSDQTKFPAAQAAEAALELSSPLAFGVVRFEIAGSLRRRKEQVGDIEILYIPHWIAVTDGLFDTKEINLADEILEKLLANKTIAKRLNKHGRESWGEQNKLAIHCASGIPVDFFQTTPECWFNYLVCRTGSAENNVRICNAAIAKGWKWRPYGKGFTDRHDNWIEVKSEQDAFELVGLKYLEPWER